MCKAPTPFSDWLMFAATFMILFIPFYNSFYATFAVTLWGFIFRKTLDQSFGVRGVIWVLAVHLIITRSVSFRGKPQGESRSVTPAVLDVSTSH